MIRNMSVSTSTEVNEDGTATTTVYGYLNLNSLSPIPMDDIRFYLEFFRDHRECVVYEDSGHLVFRGERPATGSEHAEALGRDAEHKARREENDLRTLARLVQDYPADARRLAVLAEVQA